MADEFQLGTGNWWDSTRSSTTRFDSTGPTPPTVSSTLSSMGSYESAGTGAGAGASLLADPNLHSMGLGLSSQNMDWNQALLRGGKSGSSFGTMLQEESTTTTNYQQQDEQWRQKLFDGNSDDSSNNCYNKQIDQSGVLSLDQQQYSSSNSSITCQGLNNNFQVDSTAYNNPTNVLLQGFLVSENQQQTNFDNRSLNYGYHPQPNYALQTPVNNNQLTPPSWSKFPQLLRTSPPKQPPQLPPHGQLHFSNNTPYWNASSTTVNDGQPSFFSPLQTQVPPSSFLDRSKNTSSEIRESAGTVKKNSNEPLIKRSRQETTPPPAMPAFKVRKEKMGDRITALQQLVSPFGKTDTASVLSEAIEYIKFLHDQVSVLSTPYLKSAAPINPHLNSGNLHTQEVPKQDLKSRGLCLVPVSSTFPVTHETTVDFWTPTFGGTFR